MKEVVLRSVHQEYKRPFNGYNQNERDDCMDIDKTILFDIQKALKEKSNKRKLKKYYLEKIGKGKTYTAILFDDILLKALFLIICTVFFYIKTSDIWFSGIISLQFLLLYIIISYKIKKVKYKKAVEKINSQVAKKKIYKDLTNETPYDFIEEIKSNLEKCNFQDLKISSEKDLDLVGDFKENKIGIKCFQYTSDYKVNANAVREFFLVLRKHELNEGMIITTSSFLDDTNELLPKLENYVKIHLLDMDDILNIMKKAETYPSNSEIEKNILNKVNHKKRKLKEYRDTVLSKGKSSRYIIIGFIIYFFGRFTPYDGYYTAISVLLFILGIVSIANYLIKLFFSENSEDNKGIV
ncbi:MAG: restriction endonuclease [Firmicutes bacterium]|nr:restriction endonuclease [Bacillota bacterium]